jgi:hypothetical protein
MADKLAWEDRAVLEARVRAPTTKQHDVRARGSFYWRPKQAQRHHRAVLKAVRQGSIKAVMDA